MLQHASAAKIKEALRLEQPRASERETAPSELEDEDDDCSNLPTIMQPPEYD
jgi:hypothetical protein